MVYDRDLREVTVRRGARRVGPLQRRRVPRVRRGPLAPNPGADEVINAPYDITVTRIDR